jgi:diacylglycerol kinase (ATP)
MHPPPYPSRKSRGFFHSLIHAWNGLVHTVVHQRNMRVHVVAAVLVGLVGSGIPLGLAEKVTLIFCVLIVFFAEILNSALEQLVDLATTQLDERARVTKDAAAAGVFMLAAGAVVIFLALLVHNWETISAHGKEIRRQALLGVPVALGVSVLLGAKRAPRWVHHAMTVLCVGLLVPLAMTTTSAVFTAMVGALVVLGTVASHQRAIEYRKQPGRELQKNKNPA